MPIKVDIKKRLAGFTLELAFCAECETMGLLGRSGSGKSMTLQCIAGVVRPDEGRIELNGRVLFDSAAHINLPPQQRHTGILFQNYALFPTMTVEQNIRCGMRGSRGDARVQQVIRQLELSGLEQRYPSQLSGGQQQRAALARMLVAQPEILLLDEPFSALDTHLRAQVRQLMADVLAEFDGPALLVTHDFTEAVQLCPRAAVLSDGRIAEAGDCAQLWKQPHTRCCAELTGMQNFLPLPADMQPRQENAYCIGIRPDCLHPARPGDAMVFDGVVRRILPGITGDHIVLETAQGTLVWQRTPDGTPCPQVGARCVLSAKQTDVHLLQL